jgi:hypothetical protein
MDMKEKYRELIKRAFERRSSNNDSEFISFQYRAHWEVFIYLRDNVYDEHIHESIYCMVDEKLFDDVYCEVVNEYIDKGCLVSKDDMTWSFKNPNLGINPEQIFVNVTKRQIVPMTGC